MKKIFLLIFLLGFCAGVGKSLYFLKKGFSTRRIHSLGNCVSDQWSEEANEALAQPYRYLGRGRQCFAFASADGKYVVKLPRTDIYKLPFWVRVLPLPTYRQQLLQAREEREAFILESIKIASEELPDQTAILAVHLGQSASQGKNLTLIDALGCKHQLPLEKTSFILQYKHPLLMGAFQAAMTQGNRKEAGRILDALFAAIIERGAKGILNRDRSFLRNYGFDGQKAYQIDVGSFFRQPGLSQGKAYEKSVRDSVDAVREWMVKNHPDFVPVVDQKLRECFVQ